MKERRARSALALQGTRGRASVGLMVIWGLLACGTTEVATQGPSPERTGARWPQVVVVERLDSPSVAMEQKGGADAMDMPPRLSLAFRHADGRQVPIDGAAYSFVPFRDGVAMIDRERRLVIVSPNGSRRVLARQSGAPPARGPSGALLYVAQHGLQAELHMLSVSGADRVIGSGFAHAGVLAPQATGEVLFVAARSGGVAGLWIADAQGSRCLTNCDLGRAPWGDAFLPPPGDPAGIVLRGAQVRWKAFDGTTRTVSVLAPVETTSQAPARTFRSEVDGKP